MKIKVRIPLKIKKKCCKLNSFGKRNQNDGFHNRSRIFKQNLHEDKCISYPSFHTVDVFSTIVKINQTIKKYPGTLVYLIVFNTPARFHLQLIIIMGYLITALSDSFSWLDNLQWGRISLLPRLQDNVQTQYIMQDFSG